MLDVEQTKLSGVKILTPRRFSDDRGFFSETYNEKRFHEAGVKDTFIQDNHSLSARKGTIRGLHFQAPPHAQAKLVRVVRGIVIDVAVDVRKGSPTFGEHVAVELSAENGKQLYIPEGFLHGFATLTENAEIAYKVNDFYSSDHDGAVLWNSPGLEIDWGIDASEAVLSEKDTKAIAWNDFKSPFEFKS